MARSITIGVTGHRVLREIDKLNSGIDGALEHVTQMFPERPLTIVSALAEGTDRLAARWVLARPGGRLIVPLLMSRKAYMKEFDSAESRQEFHRLLDRAAEVIELPAAPTPSDAYDAAGRYMLEHCDVLLAVWDGLPAQGRGGTADVIARARARKLPIAWVHAGNRKPGTNEPTSLGEAQGMVTFENFPGD